MAFISPRNVVIPSYTGRVIYLFIYSGLTTCRGLMKAISRQNKITFSRLSQLILWYYLCKTKTVDHIFILYSIFILYLIDMYFQISIYKLADTLDKNIIIQSVTQSFNLSH